MFILRFGTLCLEPDFCEGKPLFWWVFRRLCLIYISPLVLSCSFSLFMCCLLPEATVVTTLQLKKGVITQKELRLKTSINPSFYWRNVNPLFWPNSFQILDFGISLGKTVLLWHISLGKKPIFDLFNDPMGKYRWMRLFLIISCFVRENWPFEWGN